MPRHAERYLTEHNMADSGAMIWPGLSRRKYKLRRQLVESEIDWLINGNGIPKNRDSLEDP
jgi:hypothetical protein